MRNLSSGYAKPAAFILILNRDNEWYEYFYDFEAVETMAEPNNQVCS